MSIQSKNKLEVYFNSACPICDAAIQVQKNKSTACAIQWNDVHTNNLLVDKLDKDLSTVRKYLHVTDANKKQHIGIEAFILLWQYSPTERWKAKLFSIAGIRQLSQVAYFVFANMLYFWNKKNKHW